MKLILVRHPETERNIKGELSGWEECEYSKLGREQFEKLSKYLSEIHLSIYSSDLPRAKLLAEEVARGHDVNLIIDKRLREVNCRETLPHDSYESDEDLRERVNLFLREISEDCVIVSHAGVVRWIVTMFCGKEKGGMVSGFPRDTIFEIETVKNENKLSIIRV